jgi:imidazolonepropionase-like amidohydrolase
VENSALVVENGRIIAVGTKGGVRVSVKAQHVALSGKTVMPALIDTHIHIGYQKGATYSADNYTRDNLVDQLQRYSYAGVAAVMSLGTDPGDIAFQQQAEQQRKGGTLLLLAGRGIAAPNAGPGDAALKPSAWAVSTPDQARSAVREEIAKKVDFIKVWVDDRGGAVKKTPPEIYRAVIDEAHKHGVRAIAHVYYLDDAKDLARSGIDGFAHLVRDKEIDDEFIALVKQRGIYCMPNLNIAAIRALADPPAWLDDPLMRDTTPQVIIDRVRASFANKTPQALEAARKTYAIMQKNLQKLNDAGAKIILGGDSGAVPDHFHAFTSHRELQWMAEAGMTPAQVLTAGTVSAAEFLKLKDKGSLEKGKSADFIVLDANPLENIANTRKITKVFLGGRELDRAALRANWK